MEYSQYSNTSVSPTKEKFDNISELAKSIIATVNIVFLEPIYRKCPQR